MGEERQCLRWNQGVTVWSLPVSFCADQVLWVQKHRLFDVLWSNPQADHIRSFGSNAQLTLMSAYHWTPDTVQLPPNQMNIQSWRFPSLASSVAKDIPPLPPLLPFPQRCLAFSRLLPKEWSLNWGLWWSNGWMRWLSSCFLGKGQGVMLGDRCINWSLRMKSWRSLLNFQSWRLLDLVT